MKSVIENTTRHVNAFAVRVDPPLSLMRKYSAEPRLPSIRTMKSNTIIFKCTLALGECSRPRTR